MLSLSSICRHNELRWLTQFLLEWFWIFIVYILLTKREGRTGRISAQVLNSTDRAQRGPYIKDRGPIFSHYGPEQAWLIIIIIYYYFYLFPKKKKMRTKRKGENDPILTEGL